MKCTSVGGVYKIGDYRCRTQGGFTALAFVFGVSFALSMALYAYMEEYGLIFRLKREIAVQNITTKVLHVCIYMAEERIVSGEYTLLATTAGLVQLSYVYKGQNTQIGCQVTSISFQNSGTGKSTSIDGKNLDPTLRVEYVVRISIETQDQFLGGSTVQTETVFRAYSNSTELEEVYTRKKTELL